MFQLKTTETPCFTLQRHAFVKIAYFKAIAGVLVVLANYENYLILTL